MINTWKPKKSSPRQPLSRPLGRLYAMVFKDPSAPNFWTSSAARDLDEYGIAPSSVFSSTSARGMPWEASKLARPDPAPHDYNTSGYRAMATPRNPHSKASAAFASGSDRFIKTKTPSYTSRDDTDITSNRSVASLHDGVRRSASFASRSERLKKVQSRSPGPGTHNVMASDPRSLSSKSSARISGPSSGLASTSARRLPFEAGGAYGGASRDYVPAAAKYDPAPSEDYRGRGSGPGALKSGVAKKGAAALGYTSPRFGTGHYNQVKTSREVPGPGSYQVMASDRRSLGSAYSTSGRKLPLSTEERRLPYETFSHDRSTPGADHYQPASSARGMGELAPQTLQVKSAAFASSSVRPALKATPASKSPGPGGYQPHDGKATADISTGGYHRPIRRSTSFGSTSTRFKTVGDRQWTPGPGSYAQSDELASPRGYGQKRISASFASTSARTQLPRNREAEGMPGPGGYEHTHPTSDLSRNRLRRSASFSSTSERLKMRKEKVEVPPPGAYDPLLASRGRAIAGATQRYSMHRVGG